MTQEQNLEGNIVFKCSKCGWIYFDQSNAEMCEEYCKQHKSCNFEITRNAIKINDIIHKGGEQYEKN